MIYLIRAALYGVNASNIDMPSDKFVYAVSTDDGPTTNRITELWWNDEFDEAVTEHMMSYLSVVRGQGRYFKADYEGEYSRARIATAIKLHDKTPIYEGEYYEDFLLTLPSGRVFHWENTWRTVREIGPDEAYVLIDTGVAEDRLANARN